MESRQAHEPTTAQGDVSTEATRRTPAESPREPSQEAQPTEVEATEWDGLAEPSAAQAAEPSGEVGGEVAEQSSQNAEPQAEVHTALLAETHEEDPAILDDPAAGELTGPDCQISVLADTATRSPPKLFALCLRAIGRRIKYFYNALLYPADAPRITKSIQTALAVYDLAPLTLLDEQYCCERIIKWKKSWLRAKRARHKAAAHMHKLESTPLYALASNLMSPQLDPLRKLLGIAPPQPLALRQLDNNSAVAKKLRRSEKKWISDTENRPPEAVNGAPSDCNSNLQSKPPSIHEIKLVREAVTNVGCGFISALITSQSSLLEIQLQSCQITCAGAMLLANAVKSSRSIVRLDLSNDDSRAFPGHAFENDIRSPGTVALATALATNRSLASLSLRGNYVGDEGAIAIAKILRTNLTLRRLDLSRTRINNAADELIRAFHNSKSLEMLDLQWCALRPGLGSQLVAIQAAKAHAT